MIMELDDLKQTWKQADSEKNINLNIMEVIQNKSYGPLVELKKGFRKRILLMMIVPCAVLLTNVTDINKTLSSVMFWSYIAFCMGNLVFSWLNYRIVARMEGMDGVLRTNLGEQINILETRLRWNIIGVRLALLFFIALTEIVPYFQHYSMLNKWHSLNPLIRYGAYTLLLVLQYFISRKNSERKFGRHLSYLKELLKQMQ
jgi:hypothetical protein